MWYVDTTIIPAWKWGHIEFGVPVAIISLVIAATWQMTGFAVAMYLAGLPAIPDELRELPEWMGRLNFNYIRRVIFPLLAPITVSVIIIMAHISLKIFDLVYAMTGSGANFVTDVPGIFMFETTFRGNYYAKWLSDFDHHVLSVAIFIVPYLIKNRRGEMS